MTKEKKRDKREGRKHTLFLSCGSFPSFLISLFSLLFLLTPLLGASAAQEEGAFALDARIQLLTKAESLLGTPYRYGGVDRRGLDCSGFVSLCFAEALGLSIPRSSDGIFRRCQSINRAELKPGDLVFFVTAGSRISHVGIYTGAGRFIHSASEGPVTGVIYSRLDESYWNRTYRGSGRIIPWDDEIKNEEGEEEREVEDND